MEIINRKILHEKDTLDLCVPHDVIENILSQLPVKSLIRFKTISKRWEAVISDPVFARFHFQQSQISSSRQYIFMEEYSNGIFTETEDSIEIYPGEKPLGKFNLVQLKNQEFQVESSLMDYPQEFGDACFMCSSDGLLLLECSYSNMRKKRYALWNPYINTFIIFKYQSSRPYDTYPLFHGICYDPLIEDYKVVMGAKTHYSVFNCRNKRWAKKKELPFNGNPYDTNSPGMCFNGSLYWVLNKYWFCDDGEDVKFKIVRFDTRYDKLEKVGKPKCIPNGVKYPLYLVLLGGQLCLYYSTWVQLFIMKKDDDQDSWMKFITIDNVLTLPYLEPLLMTDENEILFEMDASSGDFSI